jgi:hypothetical protein
MFKATLPVLAYLCAAVVAVIAHQHDQRRLRRTRSIAQNDTPEVPSDHKEWMR